MEPAKHDIRFDEPLYTVAEAARFLGVPPSTFSTWAKGYERRPAGRPAVRGEAVVSSMRAARNLPSIPFIGLAEGLVLAAFRRAGVSLQQIRLAAAVLEREIGFEHALASKSLYTDGAVILYDFAEHGDTRLSGLTEVVSRQQVFAPVVEDYLKRIEYGHDGWASMVASPVTRRPVVVADPKRAFGSPIFLHGAAPVESVVSRIRAGDPPASVAKDFGVPLRDVDEYLGATRLVAA